MVFRSDGHDRRARLAALLLTIASLASIPASSARASLGYELDPTHPSRAIVGVPRGLAIDQATEDIYVAIVTANANIGTPGEIDRFNSDLTADGTFAKGGGFYTGVAVDPTTHNFYGAQTRLEIAAGTFGTPRLDKFSSSGTLTESFSFDDTNGMPPMGADSTGRLFYPNAAKHAVLVLNSSGVIQEEIKCSGCPGGAFGEPESVALDSSDNLYVADLAPDRVLKLTPSGGHYSSGSLIQSGRGAAAVGVDPGTGNILVGDLPNGTAYHIVAYNSSGTQIDDFGVGLFRDPSPGYGAYAAYQMAVNAATHTLYVGEYEKFYIFDNVTIKSPTVSIEPATNVGQLTATLNTTVNTNGHAALSCNFELTENADVSFAGATTLPCPAKPDGSSDWTFAVKTPPLTPATTYRFRSTAASNAGSVTSASQTFETQPELPPTVTAEPPTAVTQTAATIKARVNPKGGSVTNCHFEYGTSVSYGSSISCSALPGPVSSDVAEARTLSVLKPSTVYHYRLVVTSNAGTAVGTDVEFTTASPLAEPEPEKPPTSTEPTAPTTTPPPAPPPPPPGPTAKPGSHRCKKHFHRRKVRGKVRCVKKGHSRPQR